MKRLHEYVRLLRLEGGGEGEEDEREKRGRREASGIR